jgi:cytochrome c553
MKSPRAFAFPACLLGMLVTGVGVIPGAALAQAQSGDPAAGRQKAQMCAVCHGPMGISGAPDAPNLAAQPALYLSAQLRAYRSGERKHEVMAVMSKTLSDTDIDNLAAWFSSLQIEVRPLPPPG